MLTDVPFVEVDGGSVRSNARNVLRVEITGGTGMQVGINAGGKHGWRSFCFLLSQFFPWNDYCAIRTAAFFPACFGMLAELSPI